MKTYQLPIEKVITKLGYENSGNLFMFDQFSSAPVSSQSKKALKDIRPYAAYIVNNRPFILFFDSSVSDDILFQQISKKVWNAQIPVAIFCDERYVKIFNGLSLNLTDYKLASIKSYNLSECNSDSEFSFWQISSVDFWKTYSGKFSGTKLNHILLENIEYITNKLKNQYNISFATKLVLRLIFIRYLIDRGVDLDYKNFSNDIQESQKEFLKTVSNKKDLYDLFIHLKIKFNGNLFELGNEFNCEALTEDVFSLLFEFFSGKEIMNNGQQSLFLLYDFNIIPVELISNIYEILLGQQKRKKDNAFYTPNYLVEYILDKTVTETLKMKKSFTILDPSCGSGAFLVDSYRRIVQENINNETYCEDDSLLKDLLTKNIYGIDINEEAIDVTIFSLYLTILDYKDPKTLSHFVLPNLKGNNLFVSDFFDEKSLSKLIEKNISFDFIIGNPPWGNEKHGLHMSYCKSKGYIDKQQNNEISRSFVFRSKDFCKQETVCCFVLHSKLLYNQKNPSVRFRQFLLKETEIQNIIELSSVRKLVFENADAPAVILSFKYNSQVDLSRSFTYISVKPNIFFKLFNIICIEKDDVKSVPQSLLCKYDWAWKTLVYGFSEDVENIIYLKKKFPSIDSALKNENPKIIYGSGIQDHIGDAQDAKLLLGLPLLDSEDGIDHFRLNLNKENIFNKPKIHRIRRRELFNPPHCIVAKGLDCNNYKMRSAYSNEEMVCKETMYVIKGNNNQKEILYNLVGLFNSSLFSYFNLMLGSSVGIEREQRFMGEVLGFPYAFSQQISSMVEQIQSENDVLFTGNDDEIINDIDELVLSNYGLSHNKFIDYAINITIPLLTNSDAPIAYKKVSVDDLKNYSEIFLKHFNAVYNLSDQHVLIVLYPNVQNHYSIFELQIINEKPKNEIIINNESPDSANLLSKLSLEKYNDRFYQLRDVVHFTTNSFLILKPNFYKYWHPAMAEVDLSDVINDIMSASGGDE